MIKKSILIIILVVFIIGIGGYYIYLAMQPSKKLKPQPSQQTVFVKAVNFAELPGWHNGELKQSLSAFLVSCKTLLKQHPEKFVGSQYFTLKVKDWHPACRAAQKIDLHSHAAVKNFFETWFTPITFYKKNQKYKESKVSQVISNQEQVQHSDIAQDERYKQIKGVFTGYYMPLLKGSIKKTEKYHIPLYGLPNNLITVNLKDFNETLPSRIIAGRVSGNKLVPYYTRAEINQGAIKKHAPIIAWLDNHVDRTFLEIQGSGLIELEDLKRITVNYAGENGAPYTSIAKVLINKGIMTKHNASMQRIKDYLNKHADQMHTVLNQNKSFVFFDKSNHSAALGAQGIFLTPGYSLAIDRQWIPLGAPIWQSTTRPRLNSNQDQEFNRLMIAQDIGGAIKGVVRGDVYWGSGEQATQIAGRMKNRGSYWILLPRHVINASQFDWKKIN